MTSNEVRILKRMIDQEQLEGVNASTDRIRQRHGQRRDVLRELHSALYAEKVARRRLREEKRARTHRTNRENAHGVY